MFNKKFLFVLILSVVAVAAVSAVSAADANQTADIAALSDNIETTNEITQITEDAAENLATEIDDAPVALEDNPSELGATPAKIYAPVMVVKRATTIFSSTLNLEDTDGNPISGVQLKLLVGGKTLKSSYTNSDGRATYKIPNTLKTGTYTVRISTVGSEYDASASFKLTVKPVDMVLKPAKITTYYNSGKTFTVKVSNGYGNILSGKKVAIDIYTGNKYKRHLVTSNSKGIASLKLKSIGVGTHKVVVSSATNGYSGSKTSSIKITKKPMQLTVKSLSTKKYGAIHIKAVDKITKKPVNGVKLIVRIYTGSSFKPFTLVTGYDGKIYKSNGVAAIETNKFSVGNHRVTITVSNNFYQGTATSNLKILATVKNFAKYTGIVSAGKARLV